MSHDFPTIGITGASGWLGRSAVMSIIEVYGQSVIPNIRLFGRKATTIQLISGHKLSVFAYSEISKFSFDIFVPLAFGTREKYFNLGEANYVGTNLAIIKRDVEIIRSNLNCRVILISSGAVNGLSQTQASDPSYRQYKALKELQEEEYQKIDSHYGGVKVCRLYSTTSVDLIKVEGYALASLVNDALSGGLLKVESKGLVLRRYVDFRQLFRALLMDSTATLINSSGELIEIRELARLIIKTLASESKLEFSDVDPTYPHNTYLPPDDSMETLFSSLGMKGLPLETQIKLTAKGIKYISRLKPSI